MPILIAGALVLFALIYTRTVDTNKFLDENDFYIKMLKEKDWDFYVSEKEKKKINPDDLFNKRIKQTFIYSAVIMLLIFIAIIVLIIKFIVWLLPYALVLLGLYILYVLFIKVKDRSIELNKSDKKKDNIKEAEIVKEKNEE